MKECYHRFSKINTYTEHVSPENIIDTNYQCVECGKIFTQEQAQDYSTDKCSLCDGTGKIDIPYERHPMKCQACLLENNLQNE
jgi:DNA-directed RNA polymerase subunit RPC12/RpoP